MRRKILRLTINPLQGADTVACCPSMRCLIGRRKILRLYSGSRHDNHKHVTCASVVIFLMQERPRSVYDILHLHAGGLYLNGVNGVGRFLLDLHLHVHLTEVLVSLERGAHRMRQGVVAVKVVLGLHPFASAVEPPLSVRRALSLSPADRRHTPFLSPPHRCISVR